MKLIIFRNKGRYYIKVDDKIYNFKLSLLENINIDENLEIITIALNRVVVAKIISKLLDKKENQIYQKRLVNKKGYLSYGIIVGKNLKLDNIPFETNLKNILTIEDWNKNVVKKVNGFSGKSLKKINK